MKSRGIVVSGITSDYDNDVRSTINPDPGADEFQATTQGEWTGASSTDWAVTTNWCSGSLPTSTTNVNISTYALFQPTISSNAVANNLIINPTTTLTLQSGILGIYGNLTNNGTYNQTGGTIEMDGSNGQSLPPITVYDFVMNDPNGVTLSGDLTITNSLSLLTGLINTSSNRVIVSNSSSHAIVGYQNNYSQSSYAFSSYINGTLRRAISNGLYYDFPVGTSSFYELASLNINSVSGISTIDVSFSSNNIGCTNPNPANLNVNGTPISVLQDAGHWSYSPDNISGSIDYDLTEYMRGSTNPAPAPTYYALIKREDCSHDWYNPGTQDGSLQDEQFRHLRRL